VVCLDRPGRGTAISSLGLLGIEDELATVDLDLRAGSDLAGVLAEHRVESVFHLAAQTIVGAAAADPLATFETNVRATWMLLEACRERGVERVVVASSDKAYGSHDELPYREDHVLKPRTPYEASKAAADLIARSYWHSRDLPVAVTRFANVYGGGDTNFSRLVPEAVSAALDGRPPVLRSDGSPERDFLHVEDATRAYLAIADALDRDEVRGEAFNAGGGRPHPVRQVVDLIARLAGTGVEPDVRGTGNPSGEIDRQYVDSSKIRALVGWEPRVDLEPGLRRTIGWYRDHPEVRAPPVS
jgi:CDP-glucose 4,6-dehydratase